MCTCMQVSVYVRVRVSKREKRIVVTELEKMCCTLSSLSFWFKKYNWHAMLWFCFGGSRQFLWNTKWIVYIGVSPSHSLSTGERWRVHLSTINRRHNSLIGPWVRRKSGSSINHKVVGLILSSTCGNVLEQHTEPQVAPDEQDSALHVFVNGAMRGKIVKHFAH